MRRLMPAAVMLLVALTILPAIADKAKTSTKKVRMPRLGRIMSRLRSLQAGV